LKEEDRADRKIETRKIEKSSRGILSKIFLSKSFQKSNFRRAQVTVFVILGIVILAVLLFGLWISSLMGPNRLKNQAEEAVESYLRSDAVSYYVYTCMDASVNSAIYELSRQGGVFFDYQNGTYNSTEEGRTHIPFTLTVRDNTLQNEIEENFNVSYSIQDTGYFRIVEEEVPAYPYNKTYVRDMFRLYRNLCSTSDDCYYDASKEYSLSGFAGFNNMSRLCSFGSNNTRTIRNLEFSPCAESIILNDNKSIEKILAKQISMRMYNCTDFSVFVDDNITVSGLPLTQITYSPDSVMVDIIYNLTVKIKNKEPVIVKHTFSYRSNLRFVRIHNYAMSLIRADSSDFLFDLNNNHQSYGLHSEINPAKFFDAENMNISIINFTDCDCPYENDKLLIIEDGKSIVGNRPILYMTMIKNRIPVLDYIHLTPTNSPYDIIVSTNQEITIEPQGYDPDDDKNITYLYEGWKENYDEKCEVPVGLPATLDNLVCIKNLGTAPNLWTMSEKFVRTKRAANYSTDDDDLGPHNITITARETSGLSDYQNVQILVFDLPKAKITPREAYSDILNDKINSIEDVLTLDGSLSTSSEVLNGNINRYTWTITSNGQLILTKYSQEEEVYVPDLTGNNDTLIQEIKHLPVSRTGWYNVTLVTSSYIPVFESTFESPPDVLELELKECLPHRSTDYAFPYNTGDAFSANHSCCSDDYAIMPESSRTSCYNTERYGQIDRLLSDATLATLSQNSKFDTSLYSPSNSVNSDRIYSLNEKNDVYRLTFNRFCDGERGNICAGDMQRTITLSDACEDLGAGEIERCEGPQEGNSLCVPYGPGMTFETAYGSAGATGICNTAQRCSSLGSGGYNAGGNMICRATCSTGDCNYARLQDCSCNVTACGARCDATHQFNWTGTTCSFGCQSNTCLYAQTRTLPCTASNSYCFSSTSSPNCTFNVVCNATGGGWSVGEGCIAGAAEGNICRYNENPTPTPDSGKCNSAGSCLLGRSDNSTLPPCPDGQRFVCDRNLGWQCRVVA
jgi:hypothetical protein